MSFSDIKDWRIGKKFQLGAGVENTHVSFNIKSDVNDLEKALELLNVYLSDFKIDKKIFEQAREQQLVALKELPKNSQKMMMKGLYHHIWAQESMFSAILVNGLCETSEG